MCQLRLDARFRSDANRGAMHTLSSHGAAAGEVVPGCLNRFYVAMGEASAGVSLATRGAAGEVIELGVVPPRHECGRQKWKSKLRLERCLLP